MSDRIATAARRSRVVDAEAAAALIGPGETIATSGFTGSGYPKLVPQALARRMTKDSAAGRPFLVHAPFLHGEGLAWHRGFMETGNDAARLTAFHEPCAERLTKHERP